MKIPGKVEFDAIKTSGHGNSVPLSLCSLILVGNEDLHKNRNEEEVVEVLQYNGVNMKVISTKRTTVKMGLIH